MAAKKKSAKKGAPSPLSIVRGGERFDLNEVEDLFAIKRRRGTRRGELNTAREHPGSFAGVEFCAGESTADVEVFRVDADSRDEAMTRLRETGTDSHWCAHVYHMADDADGLMIPTDSMRTSRLNRIRNASPSSTCFTFPPVMPSPRSLEWNGLPVDAVRSSFNPSTRPSIRLSGGRQS